MQNLLLLIGLKLVCVGLEHVLAQITFLDQYKTPIPLLYSLS